MSKTKITPYQALKLTMWFLISFFTVVGVAALIGKAARANIDDEVFAHIAIYQPQDRPLEPSRYLAFTDTHSFFQFLDNHERRDDEFMEYYVSFTPKWRLDAYKFRRQYSNIDLGYYRFMTQSDVELIQRYWASRR